MKNKMYFYIIIIISIFLFNESVLAEETSVMYMDCFFSEANCAGEDSCIENINSNTFVVINDEEDHAHSAAIDFSNFFSDDVTFSNKAKYIGFVDNTCWHEKISDIDDKCDKENDGRAMYLRRGICPVGVRNYFVGTNLFGAKIPADLDTQFFKVPAGISNSSPKNYQMITKPEYVLYKIKGYYDDDGNYVTLDTYVFEVYNTDGQYGMIFAGNREYSDSQIEALTNLIDDSTGPSKEVNYIDPTGDVIVNFFGGNYYLTLFDTYDAYKSLARECWLGNCNNHKTEYIYSNEISLAGFTQILRLLYIDDKSNYFKVATEYDARFVSIATNRGKNFNRDNIEVVYSSNSINQFRSDILEWYEANMQTIEQNNNLIRNISGMSNLITNAEKLVDSSKNGDTFTFPADASDETKYNVDMMINDLEIAYNYLDQYDDGMLYQIIKNNDEDYGFVNDPITSANNFILNKYFGDPVLTSYDYDDMDDGYFGVNSSMVSQVFLKMFTEIIENMTEEGIISLTYVNEIKEKIMLFSTATAYLDKYANDFALSDVQKDKVNDLRRLYSALASKYDVYAIVDCKGIIGEELVEKINSVLNIIKIVIPSLLIIFGIIDFTKAFFANDDSKMKNAQTVFLKRIGISIIIFLTPTFVNFILQIANKVWKFISPDTCGLF